MPIYEYHCAKCTRSFDHLARSLSDKPKKCPECGSVKINRQLSTFAPRMAAPAPAASAGCGGCANAPACPAAGGSAPGCCGGH